MYWAVLGWDGTQEDVMCWAALRHTRMYGAILGHTGPYWDGMGHTQGCDVPGCIRTYWDILGHTGTGRTGRDWRGLWSQNQYGPQTSMVSVTGVVPVSSYGPQ